MTLRLAVPFACLAAALAAAADDPKPAAPAQGKPDAKSPPKEPPPAPDGWKYVEAKDKSYQFLFPTDTRRAGSRESTSKRGGLNLKQQVNYAVLKDGTEFSVTGTKMSGAALKGLTIGDVYK